MLRGTANHRRTKAATMPRARDNENAPPRRPDDRSAMSMIWLCHVASGNPVASTEKAVDMRLTGGGSGPTRTTLFLWCAGSLGGRVAIHAHYTTAVKAR